MIYFADINVINTELPFKKVLGVFKRGFITLKSAF